MIFYLVISFIKEEQQREMQSVCLKLWDMKRDVIQKADETAQNFMKTGNWSL